MRKNSRSKPGSRTAQKKSVPGKKPPMAVPVQNKSLFLLICGLLVAAAAFLRYRGAQNDLWMDEFWSLNLAKGISSPLAVLTSIHHDNNHYLNTLWMVLMPGHGNWWGYRIPSILAGTGTVIVAGLIGNLRGRINALILMLLTTFSFFLVLYSSEARGYSAEVFFAFLSFFFMDRFLQTRKAWLGILYSGCILLGVLSHLAFILFYMVMIAWSAYRLFPRRSNFRQFAFQMFYCHAFPAAFLAWLYMVDLRVQTTGGGRIKFSVPETFGEALTWACGGQGGTAMVVCLVVVGVLAFAYGSRVQWRLRPDSWIWPVGVTIFFPLLFVLIYQMPSVYVRHFIISMAFLLVLISICLTSLFERGRAGQVACLILLASFVGANAWHTRKLFIFGRGSYSEAIRYIQQNSSGNVVTIVGDHPFRIPFTLSFYSSLAKMQKELRYFNIGEWPAGGPEWIIFHKPPEEDDSAAPPPYVNDAEGKRYALAKDYPIAPFSGLHWFIYHKLSR
jgi:hypothetical protein